MNKQTTIPDNYEPDWLERMDNRCRMTQVVTQRMQTLMDDLGGPETLSMQKKTLVKHAVFVDAMLEKQEAALCRGETVDQGKMAASMNTLCGLLKTLGLDRAVKDLNLSDYIASRKTAQ